MKPQINTDKHGLWDKAYRCLLVSIRSLTQDNSKAIKQALYKMYQKVGGVL